MAAAFLVWGGGHEKSRLDGAGGFRDGVSVFQDDRTHASASGFG